MIAVVESMVEYFGTKNKPIAIFHVQLSKLVSQFTTAYFGKWVALG